MYAYDVLKANAQGGGGMSGMPQSDFVDGMMSAGSVGAGTIEAGFGAARNMQPAVSTWARGAKAFGRASNILSLGSAVYDFGTGTAKFEKASYHW